MCSRLDASWEVEINNASWRLWNVFLGQALNKKTRSLRWNECLGLYLKNIQLSRISWKVSYHAVFGNVQLSLIKKKTFCWGVFRVLNFLVSLKRCSLMFKKCPKQLGRGNFSSLERLQGGTSDTGHQRPFLMFKKCTKPRGRGNFSSLERLQGGTPDTGHRRPETGHHYFQLVNS